MKNGKEGKDKKDVYLQKKYGLSLLQWKKMQKDQDGKCRICKRAPKGSLQTDHDHKTMRVRGLLCFHCNYILLGRGKENPDRHEAAAEYLRSTFDGRKL